MTEDRPSSFHMQTRLSTLSRFSAIWERLFQGLSVYEWTGKELT